MAGIFLNKENILNILNWQKTTVNSNNSWEANNLHVDEIFTKPLSRKKWLRIGLYGLDFLDTIKTKPNLIPFLHVELRDIKFKPKEPIVTKLWLENNLHEFTPPSLNYCDVKYFEEFLKELLFCGLIRGKFYFFRTYYDTTERMFSQEIYIFNKVPKHIENTVLKVAN